MKNSLGPVTVGLAVGIAFVLLFAIFIPSPSSPSSSSSPSFAASVSDNNPNALTMNKSGSECTYSQSDPKAE